MDETTRTNDIMKHRRWQMLSESLASMRTAEMSDVILNCEDKEFYAHRVILEASSPYFVTMFRCGLEETKSGRVLFQDVDPEALEVILIFLYLGEVDKIQTTEQVKKVLESAHLMQLEHLVEYCCDALVERLSIENFVDIWNIASKFGNTQMLTKVLNYLKMAVIEVLRSPLFTSLSFDQLKVVLSFKYEIVNTSNEFLIASVAWIKTNLQERAKYGKELFEFADTKTLSKNTVKMMLEDEELMNSSEEISNALKDLAIAVAYYTPRSISDTPQLETLINAKLGKVRIVFYNDCQVHFDANLKSTVVALVNNVQEFDLGTMSWLPSFMPHPKTPTSIISGRNFFTLQDDVSRTLSSSYVVKSVCLYDGTGQRSGSLKYINRKQNMWEEIRKLNCRLSSKKFLRSSKYMYLVGYAAESGDLVIKYTVLKFLADLEWCVIPPPQIFDGRKMHFFVCNNTLCGFYYTKGELVRTIFDHTQGKWFYKVLPIGPSGITDVASIYGSSLDECIVFVSTAKEAPLTPNFIWDPETGKWTKLPQSKGKCELENASQLHKLYRVISNDN